MLHPSLIGLRALFGTFLGALGVALSTAALATPVPFSAVLHGSSDIVDVLDPSGPVVAIRTQASGSSSLGPLDYVSSDEVDLSSGRGAGINLFAAEDGSTLAGRFTVQLQPTADPAVLELLGEVDIIGGSGRFDGADGLLLFSGLGRFTSAVHAVTQFEFRGQLDLVPEPPVGALVLAALAAATVARRGRRAQAAG